MEIFIDTSLNSIYQKIDLIDPLKYGSTRNYLNGAVTRLSPYISRGVISTRYVAERILAKGYHPTEIESFLKELAWRDYFQQVWISMGNEINQDLKNIQECNNHSIPSEIVNANTGIYAIDNAIRDLYESGYMHNHARMYTASLACNIAKSHWRLPAKWMYYHLLDADWASNALSWQWVAGAFSSKKYFANQENINKYSNTNQRWTILDLTYEDLASIDLSDKFNYTNELDLKTNLPQSDSFQINQNNPTYIYNFYNLDPVWNKEKEGNRILLMEPSFYQKYPVCNKTIEFVLALSKNIEGIKVFVGEFEELKLIIQNSKIYFKEHPSNSNYTGFVEERDWLFENSKGYYPSFFNYWNKASKKAFWNKLK